MQHHTGLVGKYQVWSGGRSRNKEKAYARVFTGILTENVREGRVSNLGLLSLNNPGGF